jgi:integrase
MPVLTDKLVSGARVQTGEVFLWDEAVRGFGAKITAPSKRYEDGLRVFVVQYRLPGDGRQRRLGLGRFVEGGPAKQTERARADAIVALAAVREGSDPAHARRQAAKQAARGRADTVEKIGTQFIEKHAAQRRWREWGRVMERDVIPAWGARPVAEITRRDVIEFIDGIVARGAPIQANRVLVVLKVFFGWCLDRDIIDADPTARVKKPTKEQARERELRAPEIVAFWHACDDIGEPYGPLFRLLLLTAQRRSEIAHLEWSEIAEGAKRIEITGAKYKTGRAHLVPLSVAALAILADRPTRGNKSGLVFTTNGKVPVDNFGKAKRQLDAAMLARLREDDPAATLPPWIIHDLRRTARSGLSRLGIPADIGERILGHVIGGIRGIYDRYTFEPEMRVAMERWAAHVAGLVDPPRRRNGDSRRGDHADPGWRWEPLSA